MAEFNRKFEEVLSMFWLKILALSKKIFFYNILTLLFFFQNRSIMNKNNIQASVHTRTVFNSEQCDQIEKKLSKLFFN